MRDQVDFCEPGRLHIPVVGLEGDGMFQQASRLGTAVEPSPQPPFVRPQPIIDGASADSEQFLLPLQGQVEALANPGHPLRQQRFQPLRPGIVGRLPDRFQNRNHPRPVGRAPSLTLPDPLLGRRRTVQHANRVLAIVITGGAELVQDALFLHPTGSLVARINPPQILSSRSPTHDVTLLHNGLHSKIARRYVTGYILDCATRRPDFRHEFWYSGSRKSGCTPSAERDDPT